MNKLKFNNRSVLVARRVRALFNKINRDVSLRDKKDVRRITEEVMNSFKELYSNLGRPSVELRPFESKQVPRTAKLNLTMKEIEQDLAIAYEETTGLRQGFVEVFNHAQAVTNDLLTSSQNIGSKIIDLRILAGQQDQNVLVAGDDFINRSRIDDFIGLQNPRADVLLDHGTVILKRVSSNPVMNDSTVIDIQPVAPDGIRSKPTVGNINRFYEGNFYNYIGQARPEGGRFHLENVMSVNRQETGLSVSTVVVSSTNPNSALSNVNALLNGGNAGGTSGANNDAGQRLNPEDIIVYDRGASEGEKQIIRQNMIDDNPSSFWECEYVVTEPSIQEQVNNSRLIGLDTESTILGPNGEIEEGNVSTVTLDDLRQQAGAFSRSDTDDLVIDITVTLDAPKTINWVSLVPNNFEDTAWIDVIDISYAGNGNATFRQIPGFSSSIHDNVITEEANAELNDEEVGALLAPNKYAYRGVGVWSFEPVVAKVVRFRIRQRTATPAPYQRLAIRMHRVFTHVYTSSEADTPGI